MDTLGVTGDTLKWLSPLLDVVISSKGVTHGRGHVSRVTDRARPFDENDGWGGREEGFTKNFKLIEDYKKFQEHLVREPITEE